MDYYILDGFLYVEKDYFLMFLEKMIGKENYTNRVDYQKNIMCFVFKENPQESFAHEDASNINHHYYRISVKYKDKYDKMIEWYDNYRKSIPREINCVSCGGSGEILRFGGECTWNQYIYPDCCPNCKGAGKIKNPELNNLIRY